MQLTHPHSMVGVHSIPHPTSGNYSSCLTVVTDTKVKLGRQTASKLKGA